MKRKDGGLCRYALAGCDQRMGQLRTVEPFDRCYGFSCFFGSVIRVAEEGDDRIGVFLEGIPYGRIGSTAAVLKGSQQDNHDAA